MTPRQGLLLAATALVFSLAAGTSEAQKSKDTMRIAIDRELESLDNYINTAREGIIISRMVWDGLLYRNPETNAYEPNLATDYRWIDSTTMEFTLRQGVTFHNGERFDADDVVYTLNYVADENNPVTTQRNVNWIASAEKLGPYKVRMKLKAPFPAALEYLSGPVVMYPNEYYAKVGPDGMGVKPIGTGPYKVTDVSPGQRFVFEINKNYYKGPKGQPSVGNLIIRMIQDPNTRLAELLSGGIDWIWKVPTDQAERLEGRSGMTVVNASTMRIGYMYFDASARAGKSPLQDIRVRKAIAHAVDRKAILNTLVKGASTLVHSACFPSQFGCEQDVATYDYNPEKAKKLLAEAGHPDGFSIRLSAYRDRPYAEALISYLNAIGIKTNFNYYKYAALRDKIHSSEEPMSFMTWGSYSVNDVSAITSHFFKGLKDDYARDKQIMKWLEIADTSVDPKVRQENYTKALRKIAEQVYWLPLWSYNTWYAFSDDILFTPTSDEIPRFFRAKWAN